MSKTLSKPPSSRDSRRGKPGDKNTVSSGKDKEETITKPEEDVKVQNIETEGFGRFEFIDGTIYEGQWKLIANAKARDGEGVLKHGGTLGGQTGEEYSGSWKADKMHGYGVYKYTSGAIYSGEWVNGKQEGKGMYEFPDGSKYEGEWKNHKMHGEGVFTDIDGNKWEGIFIDGIYQSKLQKQLRHERMMKKIEEELLETSSKFFSKFEQAFTSSDKKTFKEHLLPFFSTQEETKAYFKEPYPKYEERTPDKCYTFFNIPRKIEDAKVVEPNSILVQQFNGLGQIAEFARETPERSAKLAICNVLENTWVLVYFYDTNPPK